MALLGVRVGAGLLVLAAGGLLLYRRRAALEALHRFLFEPSAPTNLAILRTALFGALARVTVQTNAAWWASVPAELRIMPPGWRWLGDALPLNEPLVSAAQHVVVVTSLAAAFGVLTRITAPIAAVLAVYVLGLPSFFGKILHMDHALVMMALVVAASPCGDALSVDRLWKRARGAPTPGASPAYTLPIRLAWLLLGTIYLFPGMWKLWNNGDLWLSGERLLWELMDAWSQRRDFRPPMRIDEHPVLLQLLGGATLVFELGIFFAIFNRYTRIVAALSAVAFHLGIRAFLGIKFYAYLPLVLLIDFPTFGAYQSALPQALPQTRALLGSAIVGCTLLAAQAFVGLAQIETWPVTLHPKLDERSGGELVAQNHQLVLEPQQEQPFKDVGRALVGMGAMNGYLRMFLNVDRDVVRGVPRQARTRALVQVIRDAGVALKAGDHIALYATRWNVYPIGKRTGLKMTLVRRYRVMEDGALEVVDVAGYHDR